MAVDANGFELVSADSPKAKDANGFEVVSAPSPVKDANGFEVVAPEQSLAEATYNAGAQTIASSVGELARGVDAMLTLSPPTSGTFGGPIDPRWNEYLQRQKTKSAAEKMRDVQSGPLYQAGSKIVAGAQTNWPVSEANKNRVPVRIAEAAGGFVVPMATGALAPLTMGAQSAGSHIANDFESLKKSGMSQDSAAERAMSNAATSGVLQASIFAALPKPLRSAGEKFIVDKIGGEGFKRWLAGRAAAASEGAVLGATSGGGEAAIAGQPMLPAMAQGGAGMAALNLAMPYLRKRPAPGEKTGREDAVVADAQAEQELADAVEQVRREASSAPVAPPAESAAVPTAPPPTSQSVAAPPAEVAAPTRPTAKRDPMAIADAADMPPTPLPQGPGAKTAAANASGTIEASEGTSLKNATAEVEREMRGMPAASPTETRKMAETWQQAKDVSEQDPNAAERVASEVVADPARGLTDVESALVLRHKVALSNRINELIEKQHTATTPEERAAARVEAERLSNQLLDIMDAAKARGSEWGREGRWRQAVAFEDFSFAAQEQIIRAKKGGAPLTDAERINLQRLADDYKAKYEELAKRQSERAKQDTDAVTGDAVREVFEKPKVGTPRVVSKADAADHVEAVKDQIEAAVSKQEQASLHPLVKKLARAIIARDNLGEKDINQLLQALHVELKKFLPDMTIEGARDALSGIGIYSLPKSDKVSVALSDLSRQALLLGQAERIENRKPVPPTGPQRAPMSDTARRILQRVNDLKRRFGVNVASPEVQLRSALQARERWYQNRLADLRAEIKTGERVQKSSPAKLTSKKLEALKAEYEAVRAEHAAIFKREMTDAQRLRLAMAGAARAEAAWSQRLANAKAGNFDPITKQSKILSSPEIEAIHARTEALRAEVEQLRNLAFPPQTPAQKALRLKLSAAERSVAEWNKRVADAQGGSFGSSPLKPKVSSAELESFIRQRESAQAEFERLKKEAFPPRSPELVAIDALKARIAGRMADLKDRMAKGDFAPTPKRAPPSSPEIVKMRAELDGIKEQFKHLRDKAEWESMSLFQKTKRSAVDAYDAARMIMTTGELSFILRQGKWSALSHPIKSAQALPALFRALRSPQKAREAMIAIRDHPDYQAAKSAKLHLVDEAASLTRQEEIYMGRWAHAMPIVAGFNRAAQAYLNKVRFDTWLAMRKSMTRRGAATPIEDAAIAQFVNESTGRGTLGKFEPAALFLGRTMFSPRYFWSRVQLLSGHSMWAGTGRSRAAIAQEYARSLVGLGLYYAMLGLATRASSGSGVSLDLDPRSADFGKVRVGNTRIDPLAGLAQVITFVGRTLSGQSKTVSGEIVPIRSTPSSPVPYGKDDWYGVAARFARSKAHPVPGNLASIFSGTEMDGTPASSVRLAGRMVAPITYFDVYDALKAQNLPTATITSLLTLLGEGLQTYKRQP